MASHPRGRRLARPPGDSYNTSMAKRDCYTVLGVARSATAAQIKAAYRKLARQYHPDVNKAPDAAAKFSEATEAYEILSDSQKRKVYDQFGHAGLAGGPAGAGGARAYARAGGARAASFDLRDLFKGGGGFAGMSLDDILESLGGGRTTRRSRRRSQPAKGADLEYPITLDFLQAARGVTTTVRLRKDTSSGERKTETIEVKIPPGVGQGQKIRLRGKGQTGPGGAGDLYIIIHVAPHAYFRREGDNVIVDVPISITEAALGGKVDVPTIDGMTTVTVPPGTSSGQRLRLKGKGIPTARTRGDQHVAVRIVMPGDLSDRGRELLGQFAQDEPYDPRAEAPWK